MRIPIFSAVILIAFVSCNSNSSSTSESNVAAPDLAAENLKGNISQVETDVYNIDSTGKTGPLDEKDIEKYDSSGYTSSYISMNGKDSVKSDASYTHKAGGWMTKMETKDANGKMKSSMDILYDSAGNYQVANSFDSTGNIDVYYTDIKSNKFGGVTSAKGYHKDSTLKVSFTNDFDSLYYVGGSSKDSTGKETYNGKVKLDDKKNMTELDEMTVTTDPKTKKDSTKKTVTTYTYGAFDNQGNWTEQTTMNEKGKATKLTKRIITYKP